MATNKDFHLLQKLYASVINEASQDDLADDLMDKAKDAGLLKTSPTTSQGNNAQDDDLGGFTLADAPYDLIKGNKTLEQKIMQMGTPLSDEQELLAGQHEQGLPKWTHKYLIQVIVKGFEIQQDHSEPHSIFVYGDTGIGKTASAEQAAQYLAETGGYKTPPQGYTQRGKKYINCNKLSSDQINDILANPETIKDYFFYVRVALSAYIPNDLQGVPIPPSESDRVYDHLKSLKFPWIRIFEENKNTKGIMFFDEINHADEGMLNYAGEMINAHLIGDTKIADDVLIIAAGNLGVHAGEATTDIPQFVERRFKSSGFLVLDSDEWLELANKSGIDVRILAFIAGDPYVRLGQENPFKGMGSQAKGKQAASSFNIQERKAGKRWPTPAGVFDFDKALKTEEKPYLEKLHGTSRNENEQELTSYVSMVHGLAFRMLGKKWADDFGAFLQTLAKFDLGDLGQKASTGVYKTDEGDAAENYSFGSYIVKVLRPITDRILRSSTRDEDGDLVVGNFPNKDKVSIRAILDVINNVRPETQAIILEWLRNPKELPHENLGAFYSYLAQHGNELGKVFQEFKTEHAPFMTEMQKEEQENQEEWLGKMKQRQAPVQPETP